MTNDEYLFKSKPRVLIVDNNEHVKDMYQDLVSLWGFAPIVATGIGHALVSEAIEMARDHRCQLALVDMHLIDDLDPEDQSGLNLLREIQPTTSIVISADGNPTMVRKSIELGAASYVVKGEGPLVLKEKLEREANQHCASRKNIIFEPDAILSQISKTLCADIPIDYHDQILDLFAALFPTARRIKLEKLGIDPHTQVSTAPRPRSLVLKVFEDDRQPVIVKLARKQKINIELKNYHMHIDGHLVGNYIPTLKSYKLMWDIGGAVFNYVGTSEQAFSHFYKEETPEKIQLSLERFFGQVWSDNYKRAVPHNQISLFDLYCQVWGREWYERAKNLEYTKPDEAMGIERWLNIRAVDPIEWLIKYIGENSSRDVSKIEKTYTGVTHGDLHGDNLLVDENHNAWVIDFERSGVGHILQDFIELESDIINRLNCDKGNMQVFYQLCIAITKSRKIRTIEPLDISFKNPDLEKALSVISVIRSLACDCTGISDAREYLLGLLFNTIFRATIMNTAEHKYCQYRALMLASIICHRLDHWDEPWPPKEWRDL